MSGPREKNSGEHSSFPWGGEAILPRKVPKKEGGASEMQLHHSMGEVSQVPGKGKNRGKGTLSPLQEKEGFTKHHAIRGIGKKKGRPRPGSGMLLVPVQKEGEGRSTPLGENRAEPKIIEEGYRYQRGER